MPWLPGQIRKPLTINYTHRVTVKRRIILHTAVSGSKSLYPWFARKDARASSHFYVAFDGLCEQYVDTDHVSWANGEGNSDSVTIETAGFEGQSWTPEQVRTLVQLIVDIRSAHPQIPLRLMESSRSSEYGIGWHRLGCDGNFPALPSILAGRTQRGGGQVWSSARGKTCPNTHRIMQIPDLFEKVQSRYGPDIIPASLTEPVPAPKPVVPKPARRSLPRSGPTSPCR